MWEKVQEQIRSGKRTGTGKGSTARRRLPIYNSRETMDETDARLEREMQTRRLREKHARDAAWEQARYEQTMRGAREKYQREHAAEKQQRELEERLGYRVPERAKKTSPLTETALLAQVYEEKAPERRRYLLQRGMNDKQQQEMEARADFERFRNDPLMGRFAAQQAGGHAPLAADSFAQQQGQGLPAQLRDMGLARADAYRAAQPAAAEVSAEQVMRKYDPAELDNARRVRAEAARTLESNRETLADMERIHRTVGRHQGSTAALSPEDAAKYEYWREMGTKPAAVMAEIRAGEAQVQNEDAIIRRQGWKDTADMDARRAARLSGRLTAAEAALVRNPQAGTLGAAEALRELYTQRAGLQAELAALDRPGEAGALKVQDVERTRSRVAAELQEVEADIRAGEYALEALRPETMAARAAGEEMGRASGKGLPYLLSLPMAQRAELARRAQHNPEIQTNIAPAGARIVYADNDLIRRAAVMTQREVQTYQALLGGKGAEEADAYMETLRPRLEKRVADAEAKEWAARAGSPLGAWLESAGSVLATVGEPAGMLMTGLNALTGRETTPYDPAFAPTRYKQAVRDTVKAGQREQFGDGFLGNLMNLGYDVVTSAGDSTLSMGLGGSVGGGLLMAGASGSGKVWEELLEGRDSRRALTAGMAAALTEGLTEHMGMERVGNVFRAGKNAGSYRLLLTQAARGFLSEALEEAPGPVVDRAVDAWLNPRNNDRTRRVQELVAGGMTPDEAIARTDAEFLLDMGYGMLAGGLSGGMMQGVAGAAGVTRAKSYERAMVKAGAAEADARVAAQQLAGIREDAEGEKALDAVAAQMQAQEDRQGEGHTPFQAAARSAGAPVQVVGVAALTEDGMEVELEGGGKAGLDSIQFEKEDVEAAYRHAAAYGDAQTARQYLAGYEASALPETLYHAGFQAAYEAGRNSRPMTEAERVKRHGGMLEPEVYRLAYQAGRDATAAQEVRLALPEALGEEIRTRIGQLPRTYAQGYTGVVYAAKMTRPTKAQAVMIDLLDAYGKAHGVHYTVVDTIGDGGANGVYTTSEGMVVALDAEEGYLTRVATHEGWHYIREHMGQEAQGLQDAVLTLLRSTEGYDLETRVAEKQEQYKAAEGQELSREEALEELTADALYDAIATPEALGAFVSRAYENAENKNAFKQAMDQVMAFINRFVAEVKALAKKIAGKNPEARAMLEHEADWGESIIQEYNRLMEEAGKRERGRTERKETGESKGKETTRSSLKTEDNSGRYDYSSRNGDSDVEAMRRDGIERKEEKDGNDEQRKVQQPEPGYQNLGDDAFYKDGHIYEYQFLVQQKDAKIVQIPSLDELMQHGSSRRDIVKRAKEKIAGRETANDEHVYVYNTYTGRRHTITNESIRHGIRGNKRVLLTNAQLGLSIGEIVENGIPINGLQTADQNAIGTYALVTKCRVADSGVSIMAITHIDQQSGLVDNIELTDVVHSVNGRIYRNITEKEKKQSRPTWPIEELPLSASTISIAQLLQEINMTHRSILSKDVLEHLQEERPENGFYTDKVLFSLRNVDTDMTEMQRVVEENEKLREAVGVLRAAMKQLSGAKAVNSRQVWKFAREIKKKYESKVRVNDLGENLRRVYDAMANARTDAEGKSAMEAMAAIARNMLENSEHINRDMYDRYADMRDYLRRGRFQLTEAQWAEAEKLYGSLKEFRNEVKGRWGVAGRKDHSTGSLDAAWEDMHAKWPEMFDRNADERGKVQQVVAALEAVQKEVSNPYGMSLDQMTQTVTAELFEGFGQVNEANALMEEAKAIARRKTTRWAINREKLAEQRKARAEVIRQKGRILKKLNSPKPGSFVPYQMREAVTALLKALDYTEGKGFIIKREMLERARQEYEAVLPKRDANGSAVPDTGIPALAAFYNGDVAEAMQRLAQSADGKQLNRLSQEETIELRDILRSYAAMIINEDRLFMQKRQDSLQEAGDGLVARMLQRKAHKQRGKAAETVLNVTNRALLSPGTVFHIFEGTEMEPIWKALRDAENTHTRHVAQGQAYMEAALKEYGVQEIINQSERKQLENGVEVTLHDGKKQKFRIQEAMYIYAAAKREKLVGTNHLLGGGIVFQKNSHPGEATGARQLTVEDLEAIAGKLTEKQKAFVDHMVQFLSRDTAEWGNQVTRELYGVEKFKESYYVPFRVARNYLRTDPASQQENRLKLGSFTKPLAQQASNPLEVQNFVEMWAAHMEQMSDYNAFVLPIEDMTRLMNYKTDNDTVRSVMQERYGNQVPDYILSFLRRLNGNAKSEMGSALVNKLVSGAKGAAVGGNLSVASQQATAVLRAYALIDARYLLPGAGKGVLSAAKMKKSYAEIMDWAPIATQKSWGYFDTNMTRGTYDRVRQTAMGKLDDALGYLSQKGDELAFTMIWEAVKREVAAESGLTRGTEAYFRRCGERFTEVIDQTQVVDSIFQRTELATEKGLARLWTSFMSEPFKQYNMLWRAGWDLKEAWRSGNKAAMKQARNQMVRTGASVMLSSVAAAAAKSLISAMRDDDDEKKEKDESGKTVTVGVRGFGEKYWDAFGPNLMDNATGLLPLVGNWLGSFITGETYNSSSMDSALLDSITRMWQALGKGDYEMAWYRGLQVVSNATGLGLGNAYRDGKALFTTLVKTLQRDTLAGTAWDKSKPFATRLQAATKNYVYTKQEGDSRRASPAVFYDLLLDAWYAGGTGEEFQQVATAMLETGATVDGIASGFKSRLRGSEELVTKAADAYEQGKYSEYEKHVLELVRLGIGQKAAVSMVDSVLDSRKKATEEPEAQTWEMLLDELTDDDADLFSTKDLLEAIQRGDQAEADYLLGRLKESKEESTIRSGLTEAYRKEYVAAWEKGDTAGMKKISDLLLGLDVGYTEESIAQWPRDEMNADYRDAIESGDAGQVRTVIAAMKKEGYTDSDLRSKLTQDYKASYTEAWNAGNKTQAQSIAAMLKGLAVGYTEDSFREWRVDSLKADWDAAVEARDVNRLKTQISRQMEAGVNQKQIRDKVWNAYGEAYVMALAEGNTSTARQLEGLMLNTGAGLTAEEVPQKAVNKAHSIYEKSVESGDLNTARQVLKYLSQAEDGDRLWDKLYNWAKDAFMDAYDSGEYADLEKNLVSMGFSQKTINGWKD